MFTVAMIELAPSPCRPRNAINVVMFHASADTAEPSRKIRVPMIRIGLRPNTSASLPYSGMVTVCASR